MTVRVSKDQYEVSETNVDVRSDLAMNVIIGKVFYADTIELGRTIRSNVSASAPPCDPIRWDARAPCRRFRLTPSVSGVLFIEIKWYGLPLLDATVVTPESVYVAESREVRDGLIVVVANLTAGQTYEVRVNSYYGSQTFDLKAEFTP